VCAAAAIFVARLATLAVKPPTTFESKQIGMRWIHGAVNRPVAETDDGVQITAADFVLAAVEVGWRLRLEIRGDEHEELIQRVGLALALEAPQESLDEATGES
jgi:hypothetical protein